MPVLLSPKEMAEVTEGYWENLTEELIIEEVEYIAHYIKKNYLFVARRKRCDRIEEALGRGAVAIMAREGCVVPAGVPVLRVKNTYMALRAIALASIERSDTRRVLVTGSYGKTGFKNHLNHVMQDTFNTYARSTSANYPRSTYCNMASLKRENELFILELPVSTRSKTRRRASYIKPDICVITSIGHEHIERFKTVENIIRNKTQIAKALKKGGKFLIPKDDPHYPQLKKVLRKYDHFDLLTFGHSRSCNAQILYEKYHDFGWDIIAKIEDVVVAYRVPFPEVHEASASLAVLLSVYHLGGDVQTAAEKFYSCHNFKSSGKIYDVFYRGKHFYLYDQSYRGGIEGYQAFFRSLATINPPHGGRKILLTSEFVDYKDGEMALIDTSLFRKLIAQADIDTLFTVEKFTEHINVLPDRSIWRNHSLDFNNIKEEVLESIEENDLLCVKGIFESHLPEFIIWLRGLEGIVIEELHSEDTTSHLQKALHGLHTLNIDDKADFYQAVEHAEKQAWVSYFPFLLTWAASTSREVLILKQEDTVYVYLLSELRRDTLPTFVLFLVPMPLTQNALMSGLERIYDFHAERVGKIMWLEEKEVDVIRSWDMDDIVFYDRKLDEFLYDPSVYQALKGTKLRHLRHDINLIKKEKDLSVVPYTKTYKEQCLALLESWEEKQGKKYKKLTDRTFTRHCLEMADQFAKTELFGLVILVDGKVRSFGFAGKITTKIGSLFIGKSDHSIRGLHTYLRYELLKKMEEYRFVNDSYALGEGMAFSKRMFRPVQMLKQFKAYIGQKHDV